MQVTDTASFIKKAREVHGDKYDYSLVEYTKGRNYVDIICPRHGIYTQRACNHTAGRGCRECKSEFVGDKCRQSLDDVLSDFRKTHGNRYDYSLVTDFRRRNTVKIICRQHGVFSQDSSMHKSGQGCKKCALISNGRKRRKTIDELLSAIKEHHGEKYKYDLTGFKGGKSKISIYCENHGWFKQEASMHMIGRGCDKCAREASRPPNYSDGFFDDMCNRVIPATFYYVEFEHIESGRKFHKFGISRKKHWKQRFNGLKKMGFRMNPIKTMKATAYECWELEQLVMSELEDSGRLYKCHYLKGTYIGGWTECIWPREWYNTVIK